MCQLENILLPVNDFQRSILYEADKSICVEALEMVSQKGGKATDNVLI